MPQKAFVQPRDRVKRWNIYEGDKVRLLVGKPEDKFVDGRSVKGGWKVHEVTGLDMERNRVLLKNVTYKKANPLLPDPANFDSLAEEDKRRFRDQQNFLTMSRPVHYSNVQLCVEERDPIDGESIFASRISTSAPVFDKVRRRLVVQRYAANTTGTSETLVRDPLRRGQVIIPQPDWKVNAPEHPQPNLDTISRVLEQGTLTLVPPEHLREVDDEELPLAKSARAPPSELPRAASDNYIQGDRDPHVDTMMPLYLSEELSPRFSRAKATKGWNLRREQEQQEREAYVKKVVDDWHARGKDAGLEEAMRQVGINAIRVRGRTADEVRAMAAVEYEQMVEERSKLARQAKRVGARHDVDKDKWMVPLENSNLTRKAKRARRAARREEKLRQMEL